MLCIQDIDTEWRRRVVGKDRDNRFGSQPISKER
jgi:hypothetical protein